MGESDVLVRLRLLGGSAFSGEVKKGGGALRRFAADSHVANAGLGRLGGALRIAAGAAGFAGLTSVVGQMIGEYREAARANRQTAAVIKSTGGVANVTGAHVSDLATQISNYSGIQDDVVQGGENMLLTFTNLRNQAGRNNKIFDSATSILVDMSSALGQDMTKSAIQLGKALNDPIAGVGALKRVGVTFNAEQMKQIKTLVSHNRLLDAQKMILRELNKEFGGSARAQADPLKKLDATWRNLMQAFGATFVPLLSRGADALSKLLIQIQNGTGVGGRFRNTVLDIAHAIGDTIGWFRRHRDATIALASGFGVLVGALTAVKVAMAAMNVMMLANPIGLVIAAVATLAAGFVFLWQKSNNFRTNLTNIWKWLRGAATDTAAWVTNAFHNMTSAIVGTINAMIDGLNAVSDAMPLGLGWGHIRKIGERAPGSPGTLRAQGGKIVGTPPSGISRPPAGNLRMQGGKIVGTPPSGINRPPAAHATAAAASPLVAHLTVNLDSQVLHRGIYRVERAKSEA